MDIYYDPLDPRCKSITGAIQQNTVCVLTVFGKNDLPCELILQKDGEREQTLPMRRVGGGWRCELTFAEAGLYFYSFRIGGAVAGMGALRRLTFLNTPQKWQILVYREGYKTPDWLKGGVMYQIFPDRFYKSGDVTVGRGKWLHKSWDEAPEYRANAQGKVLNNDFFGGNLKGIREKLGYLSSLGVTVLYLNPIFKAYSNHRYDTGDYMTIDPILGTEEDLAALLADCKARGIRVILDGVFNHTGDDSLYFNKYGNYKETGAYQSKDSKYYPWYTFRCFPDSYDSWWGIDVLPAINESCPSYIEFITGEDGVLRHWLRAGVGGWRLDVADELPDEFVEKIRAAVKSESSEAVLIGEVWEDASNKIAYSNRRRYFQGNELDSVMNYPLKNAIIHFVTTNDSSMLRETIAMLRDNYPKAVQDSLMNILGTHDTFRILTALGGVPVHSKEEMSRTHLNEQQYADAKEKLKTASLLQFTLFGVPCIYYGDEIGMEGYADPFCRFPFAWNKMDEDLLRHYKKLSRIRNSLNVFKDSAYTELYADKNCIVFERRTQSEVAVIGINRGSNRFDLKYNGTLYELLSGDTFKDKYTLLGNSICILSNKDVK